MSESVDEKMGNTHPPTNSSTHPPLSPRTHPLTNSSTHLPNNTPIIQVKHLSKRYQIGMDRTYKTFCENFTDTIKSPLKRLKSFSRQEEVFWALKHINFDVFPGEVVGIIGRNGAGKSTLLKILSRVTHPTEGEIILRGRVGSLLEVGTGFHPELTGRENIYFNGAILGMTKQEIEDKFDEIVEFSGVADFLDTPLKRYSSGMHVRLAFAVAAHLEPEILMVDEVLAVGDVEFQKKCLGKMKEVSEGGRTVLFVSHNMSMIRSLCERCILLEDGKIAANGKSDQVVNTYLSSWNTEDETKGEVCWAEDEQKPGCDEIRLCSIRLLGPTRKIQDTFAVEEPIIVEVTYQVYTTLRGMRIVLSITTEEGVIAFSSTDHDQRSNTLQPGQYRSLVTIPGGLLNRKKYFVQIHFGIPNIRVLIQGQEYLSFTCIMKRITGPYVSDRWPGVLAPHLEWSNEKMD